MKKILLIQTAFIGDAILASAVLEALHREHPYYRLDLLLRKGNEGLYDCHPFLGKIWIWDKKPGKYTNLLKLCFNIRKEHYDIVINLQRFFSTGLITILSGATEKRGFSKNPLSWAYTHSFPHEMGNGGHETERNHRLLKGLVDAPSAKPKLYLHTVHEQRIEQYKHSPYVTFAPASVWYTKQFPAHKWKEALSELPEHLRVIAIGASGDRELCQGILDGIPGESGINLCGELNLLESAALMKHASLNMVNDSAPMHLASAIDAPVAAIFCSTIPAFGFGPLSGFSRIIETTKPLSCRPCGLHGFRKCPEGHFKCAEEIHSKQFTNIYQEL